MSADRSITMTTPEEVRGFVAEPVPPAGTPAMTAWMKKAAALGPEAAPYLLEALREGDENAQNAALFALRYVGYEAWAEGYGGTRAYRYRPHGVPDWGVVHPHRPPPDRAPGGLDADA
jgi:hypothetical protein